MAQFKGRILVVDDDQEIREMLFDYLTSMNYEVIMYEDAVRAYKDLSQGFVGLSYSPSSIDAIITDLSMPGMNGIEFIQKVKKIDTQAAIILITAFGTIESAIEATKVGAYSYIVKPFKLNELELTLRRAIAHSRLQKENIVLKQEVKKSWKFGRIIGKSKAIKKVLDLVERVANATANVLITGESGTGKEIIAKAIHENGSRQDKPFVAVNCSAIPENLMESEFFGHVKGSFTGAYADKAGLFEEASGGTLFLDEIGDLDLGLQAKLLRVLQERTIKPVGSTKMKKIDVRVITATHKDLSEAIKSGEFREDLYYRLCVIPVKVPSLKERREDIPLLAEHFLTKYSALNNSGVVGFTAEATKKLIMHDWAGNVRELENLIERLSVLSRNKYIDASEISTRESNSSEAFYSQAVSNWPTIDRLEKKYIEAVLEKVEGKKERAAKILGINRRTLYRKEKEYQHYNPEKELNV